MNHKLTDQAALACGGQLLAAIESIQVRHGWSDGDTLAVAVVAITELAARKLGPAQTAELFADHASALRREHEARARI